ncbi:MAG: ATP-dependent DNA helicase RecG [Succinivibrio sp.]
MENTPDEVYCSTDIKTIKGLGGIYADAFYQKGINSLFDLMLYFPYRYLDKTKLTAIADLKTDGNFALIDGIIINRRFNQTSKVRILNITVEDSTGRVEAVFFNLYQNQIQQYQTGRRILAFGPVKASPYNMLPSMTQPVVTFLNEGEAVELSDRMTPVYHAAGKTPQKIIAKTCSAVLDRLKNTPLTEYLPNDLNPFGKTITEAILDIHTPLPPEKVEQKIIPEKTSSFKRVCFEELIAYQLTLLCLKKKNDRHLSFIVSPNAEVLGNFIKKLPFELTSAQKKAFDEISADLNQQKPMLRLLQGDVGSGKTMIAVLSCLQAALDGYQSVLLAPTELLSVQHFKKFEEFTADLKIKCVLLTSQIKGKKREDTLEKIASGEAQIIIGTHAVFQSEVNYHSLALAVIDEQHRFGIEQRQLLLAKAPEGMTLHQLAMTATPIPRTLQLALFSDLDVSILNELPKGRKPITTTVMSDSSAYKIVARLNEVCRNGIQAYWVCPSIDEGDGAQAAVTTRYKELKKALPDISIGLLHGQLKSDEKNQVMKKFLEGKYQILVATTIIEVGVDVPNASIMVIESADSFGLSQLHQLRGRVGRGQKDSYCVLLHQNTDDEDHKIAMQRLMILKSTNDGFKIATEDLKLRGPGEVLGEKQSGFDIFTVVDVNRDFELIEECRDVAQKLLSTDLQAVKALVKRWFPKFKI